MWKRKRTLKEEYGTLGHFLRGDNECHYLGDLYIEGTNFYFHREWRGVKDTAYAFARWLQTWGKMAGLIGRDPVRMIRAFWKYRWLSAYLATPMMVDKWIEGDRGMVLRADLTAIDCMVSDSITTLWREIRADRRFGENKWTDKKMDLRKMKEVLTRWEKGLEGIAWNSLFWENHDQPRSVSRYADDGRYRVRSAKMLATCLHMMQGTPYVYQGEELGMTNAPFQSVSDFRDLDSINAYRDLVKDQKVFTEEEMLRFLRKKSRDNARTPFQWDDSENGGFTTGTPWMPVNPNYKEINAKAELQDPQSVFYYYKKLIQLRKEYPVIVYGKYQLLLPDDPDLFVYTRELEKEKLLVVCNFSGKEQSIQLPEEFVNGKCLISNLPGQYDQQQVQLKPYQAFVLYR